MTAPGTTTEVVLNGETCRLDEASTVAEVVQRLDCGADGVAVAVNEEIVPRSGWAGRELHDGDRIEVVRAAQGG